MSNNNRGNYNRGDNQAHEPTVRLELPLFECQERGPMADRLMNVFEYIIYLEARRAYSTHRLRRANRELDEMDSEVEHLNRRIRDLEGRRHQGGQRGSTPIISSDTSITSEEEDPTYVPPGMIIIVL